LIVETKDPLIAERLYWEFINEGAFIGEERKNCVAGKDVYNRYVIDLEGEFNEIIEVDDANMSFDSDLQKDLN